MQYSSAPHSNNKIRHKPWLATSYSLARGKFSGCISLVYSSLDIPLLLLLIPYRSASGGALSLGCPSFPCPPIRASALFCCEPSPRLLLPFLLLLLLLFPASRGQSTRLLLKLLYSISLSVDKREEIQNKNDPCRLLYKKSMSIAMQHRLYIVLRCRLYELRLKFTYLSLESRCPTYICLVGDLLMWKTWVEDTDIQRLVRIIGINRFAVTS